MNTNRSDKSLKLLEQISGKSSTLGNFLWAIRECDNLSQATFAKKLGVSRQFICDLEHHRRTLSLEKAAQFAKKLGYSEEQFIRLTLQEQLDKLDLPLIVKIQKAA